MQAQAYRSAKQLPFAANVAITGRNIHSGMLSSRRQLVIAANVAKTLVTKPAAVVLSSRWSAVLSLSRSTLPRHFSHRTYKFVNNIAYYKDNVRYFSNKKNKYCLKRLVNRPKASRLDSVKDALSGANQTVQHRAAVVHDKVLQAVFAGNAEIVSVAQKVAQPQTHVAVASFTKVDKEKVVEGKAALNKSTESYTTDIQVTSDNSVLPLSRVAGSDVNGAKVRAWHRISGAVRSIPSPNWGKLSFKVVPLVSKVQDNSKSTDVDDQDNEHRKDKSAQEKSTVKFDKELSVGAAGGFDCDTIHSNAPETQVLSDISQPPKTNSSVEAEKSSGQDANFYQRVAALREKLPPLSVPSSVSDKLPDLYETTSKVRQKVSSVNLPTWKKEDKTTSPDSKGDFDLDSPLLMGGSSHHRPQSKKEKKEYKSDNILVAEQLLEHAEPIEVTKSAKAKKAKKTVMKPVSFIFL